MAKRKDKGTTTAGFMNHHKQKNLGKRLPPLEGTDNCQYVYVINCTICGLIYGANGSDIHLRKCPNCQGGSSGLPIMAQASFENPNKPEQPAKGVYRWYYKDQDGAEVTIYVGKAGGSQGANIVRRPSTLARGISELQRDGGISSTEGKTLDTDFIVGTAIEYIKTQGFDCYWQHCSNDPRQERKIRDNCIPLLQTRSTRIDKAYKLEEYKGYWTSNKVSEASNRLKSLFTASNMLSPKC